jgi:hypothetical protein
MKTVNILKKWTSLILIAAIMALGTSVGAVETEKQTAMTTITDPGGGGGWEAKFTQVADGDPGGGGGWEPIVAPAPDDLV